MFLNIKTYDCETLQNSAMSKYTVMIKILKQSLCLLTRIMTITFFINQTEKLTLDYRFSKFKTICKILKRMNIEADYNKHTSLLKHVINNLIKKPKIIKVILFYITNCAMYYKHITIVHDVRK